MHLGLKQLRTFFDAHESDDHLVLATVVATAGSTYRKAGAMMLVAADESHAGLISGGCLEADLVQHTRPVFADGVPRRLAYDLHDDQELVLSLGLGCGGDVFLLLQRLDRRTGFGVLPTLFACVEARDPLRLALVTGGDAMASHAMLSASEVFAGDERLRKLLASHPQEDVARAAECELATGDGAWPVLLIRVDPPPHVLICGAGPDAVPVAAQLALLGWNCTVVDHRGAFARTDRFPAGTRVLRGRPGQLGETVVLSDIDAAVVMSHHVDHDAAYLSQLLTAPPEYLGLLGPARRRHELAARIGADPERIRGPVGLDIGAELPESIALSIAAELHAVLGGHAERLPVRDVARG